MIQIIHSHTQHSFIRLSTRQSIYQSSASSCFLAIAFFLASNASARPPARLGVGVVLLLPSDPPFAPFRLMPESRCCSAAGFLPAAGRFAGGCGAEGLPRPAGPFVRGGGGGSRGATTGAGACSSTYAAGTQACLPPFFASHHPIELLVTMRGLGWISLRTYRCSPSARSQ